MKKLIVLILIICAATLVKGQGFPGTDSLRTYNIKYITNNAATAFTNLRLHTLLRGIIDWIDTARAGTGGGGVLGIDTLYALNDSTIRYRRNGTFQNHILKGVYDTRRKVDTAYALNDSTLQLKINGTNRNIVLPGRHWDLQGVLNNGATLTENETITLSDSLTFTSGLVIIESLNLPSLVTKVDTTANKPVVVDASGNVHKMDGWPGSASPLTNVGTGYRRVTTPNGSIKTEVAGFGLIKDSVMNANAITDIVDSSVIATQYDLTQIDTVFSTYVAYVDTLGNDATGVVNNPAKPFATLNAALDALPSWGGKIEIGIGEFMAPDTGKIKSNVWFAGSGRPNYDDIITVAGLLNISTTAPTKLVGGTIIHGTFSIPYNRNNVDMSNLGVDNGSAWVNANNGGTAIDCILYAQKYGAGGNSADGNHMLQTSTNPRTGIDVWNISVLAKSSTDLVHGILFENMYYPNVYNIYSAYGFAGIIIKTIGGVYKGLHARGHSTGGIFLKANDYSYCTGVVVEGCELGSIGSFDGAGLRVDANDGASPGVYFCTISNLVAHKTKFAIQSVGAVGPIDNLVINNSIADESQSHGFDLGSLFYSEVGNCSARSCGGDGFHVVSVTGGKGPFINNCISASNAGDGFDLSGSLRIDLENVYAEANTGYGINTTNPETYIGIHREFDNTAGGINGTFNTKLTVDNGGTGNVTLTPYAVLTGGTTATGALQQIAGLGTAGDVLTSNGAGALPTWQAAGSGSQTWQQTLTTGSTLTGDNTITGANTSLTFDDIFAFKINSDYNTKAKANGTGIYSEAIIGAGNQYWIGYTPAAGVFSKGVGIVIDTNENVGMGVNPPTTMPLYATGASTFIQGLQSNQGNFYKVSNITTDGSASLQAYFYTIDATAGNVTVTLPAASTAFGNTMGITYKFQRIDNSGNTVTIQRAGSDTINGGTSFTITTQWTQVKQVQCTSTSTWAMWE